MSKNKQKDKKQTAQAESADGLTIAGQQAAAAYCGVSARTIRNWEKQYPIKDNQGRYIKSQLDELCPGRGEEGGVSSGIKTRLLVADATFKELKGKLAKIDLDIKSGKLIAADDIERQRLSRIIEVRRVLMSLPRKLSAVLANKDSHQIHAILDDTVGHCLDVFSGQKQTAPDRVEELVGYYSLLSAAERKAFKAAIEKRNIRRTPDHIEDNNTAADRKMNHHGNHITPAGRPEAHHQTGGVSETISAIDREHADRLPGPD